MGISWVIFKESSLLNPAIGVRSSPYPRLSLNNIRVGAAVTYVMDKSPIQGPTKYS